MQRDLAPRTGAVPTATGEAAVAAVDLAEEEGEEEGAKDTNPSFYLILLKAQKLRCLFRMLLLRS